MSANNAKPGFWVGNVPKDTTEETMLLYCPGVPFSITETDDVVSDKTKSFIILFENEEEAKLCCQQLCNFVLDHTVGKLETRMLSPQTVITPPKPIPQILSAPSPRKEVIQPNIIEPKEEPNLKTFQNPTSSYTSPFTTKPSTSVTASSFSLPVNLTEAQICYLIVIKEKLNKLVTNINRTAKNRVSFSQLQLGSSKILIHCEDIEPIDTFIKDLVYQLKNVEQVELEVSDKKIVTEIAEKHECGAYFPKGDQKKQIYTCILVGKKTKVKKAQEEVNVLKPEKPKLEVFVLDTNIYLKVDLKKLKKFMTSSLHAVGVPFCVITELEFLKTREDEKGQKARQTMAIVEARQENNKLVTYTQKLSELPKGDEYMERIQNDDKIILYAKLLAEKLQQLVHIISDDRAVRVKSNAYADKLIVYNNLDPFMK
jgi:rRNA-processing protein FCF1